MKEIDMREKLQSRNDSIVSSIYSRIKGILSKNKNISDEDWIDIDKDFGAAFPSFKNELFSLGLLKTEDYHVCILVRLGFSNSDISTLMNRTASAISMKRMKLCKLLFDEEGNAKDFDNHIKAL